MDFINNLQNYKEIKDNPQSKALIMANINKLVQQINNNIINCGPECQRNKKINRLKEIYEDEQKRVINAPHDLNEARKNYYTYAFGDDAYDEKMMELAKYEINKLTKKLSREHQHNMKILNDNIQDLDNVYDNKDLLLELNNKYKEENNEMRSKLLQEKNNKNISDRKAVYENNEFLKLESYNYQLKFLYWFLLLIFLIIFFMKSMFMNKKNIVLAIILIVFPFCIYGLSYSIVNTINYVYDWFPKNMFIDDPQLKT